MAAFAVEVQHLDGGAEVALVGELGRAAVDDLDAGLRPLYHRYDADQLRIDCARLTAIDADGAAALVQAMARFGPTGRPTLLAVAEDVRRVLAAAGCDDGFEISA